MAGETEESGRLKVAWIGFAGTVLAALIGLIGVALRDGESFSPNDPVVEPKRQALGKLDIKIIEPIDGSSVPYRLTVKGLVSDPNAAVWIIVHPLERSSYWVQPRVSVRDNGIWKVQIYIGEPGAKDVGKTFEIRAVTNPKGELRENDILPDWPKAKVMSDLIEVKRS